MAVQVSKKDLIEMDRTSVSIKGVIDELRTKITMLDTEIKVYIVSVLFNSD